MATGHPDYQTWTGKAIGGKGVNAYSFSGEIDGESSGYVPLDAVPTGVQHSYVQIAISCPDDTAIHTVWLQRVSDDWIFFSAGFITSGVFDLVADPQAAGAEIRIYITNNSASTLTFTGTISWIIREI